VTWPALSAARSHDAAARLPWVLDGVVVGSVARAHLPALAAWPQWLRGTDTVVTWCAPSATRDEHLAHINAALRDQGLVGGWRDESFAIVNPHTGMPLMRTERAAARFWGTLTQGAHATGYVRDAQGQVQRLWIAQRALNKSTDPGLFDNLIGGGVPWGQQPLQTLVREGWEEAGLSAAQMQGAQRGRVLRTCRDVPEGLQWEDLHSFDLELPADVLPHNQDGEVQGFQSLNVRDALALAAGPTMTVDAALVTLDFALRHALIDAASAPALQSQLDTLSVPSAAREQVA
jgi:8-oxo-dGTP pyrophosphatase MutT (NUDIX family)